MSGVRVWLLVSAWRASAGRQKHDVRVRFRERDGSDLFGGWAYRWATEPRHQGVLYMQLMLRRPVRGKIRTAEIGRGDLEKCLGDRSAKTFFTSLDHISWRDGEPPAT